MGMGILHTPNETDESYNADRPRGLLPTHLARCSSDPLTVYPKARILLSGGHARQSSEYTLFHMAYRDD